MDICANPSGAKRDIRQSPVPIMFMGHFVINFVDDRSGQKLHIIRAQLFRTRVSRDVDHQKICLRLVGGCVEPRDMRGRF